MPIIILATVSQNAGGPTLLTPFLADALTSVQEDPSLIISLPVAFPPVLLCPMLIQSRVAA